MPRLVTGLFYERDEAERAIQALKAHGIPVEDIYLETEVLLDGEIGRKGGEVVSLEQERRFAGMESGSIIGLAVGLLAGIGVGMMGAEMGQAVHRVDPSIPWSPVLANPWWTAILGALCGLIAGALIGWVVDYTLTRMGAGPPLPAQETLVTVRADEAAADDVYEALFRARARHLHVSQSAPA